MNISSKLTLETYSVVYCYRSGTRRHILPGFAFRKIKKSSFDLNALILFIPIIAGIRPGKEYTYTYTTQLLTGVSVDNIQYAGLKIKANVTLQTKDSRKVTAKVSHL